MNKIRNQKLLEKLGKHLRKIRLSKNLTQEELAYQADVPISQIGRIERGEVNVTISTLYVLSKSLNTDLSHLLNFKAL